jgi:valyl-tRNA synthetase
MRLLHPFMPFVTEAIWQALPDAVKIGEALIVAPWPMADAAWLDEAAEMQMSMVQDLVQGVRAVRSDYNVQAGKRIAATVAAAEGAEILAESRDILASLARLDGAALNIVAYSEPLPQSASVVVGDVVAYLPLAEMVDLEAERARLEKELQNLRERIAGSEARLAGPFAERAPAEIVQRERDKLAAMRVEAGQIEEQIARLVG